MSTVVVFSVVWLLVRCGEFFVLSCSVFVFASVSFPNNGFINLDAPSNMWKGSGGAPKVSAIFFFLRRQPFRSRPTLPVHYLPNISLQTLQLSFHLDDQQSTESNPIQKHFHLIVAFHEAYAQVNILLSRKAERTLSSRKITVSTGKHGHLHVMKGDSHLHVM